MKVTPILAPSIDWGAFVAEAHAALKRSPIAGLVMAGITPGNIRSVIPALGEFRHKNTAAIPFLKSRECDPVLSHLYVSFLIEGDAASLGRLCTLGQLQVLSPDDCNTAIILTGSLREWRDVIVSGSRSEPPVREIATEIHRCLVAASLGDLFAGYFARKQADGTVILEAR